LKSLYSQSYYTFLQQGETGKAKETKDLKSKPGLRALPEVVKTSIISPPVGSDINTSLFCDRKQLVFCFIQDETTVFCLSG
jgi:hypothetical protein